MSKFRITILNETANLRGYADSSQLAALADALKPLDMLVIASPMEDEE